MTEAEGKTREDLRKTREDLRKLLGSAPSADGITDAEIADWIAAAASRRVAVSECLAFADAFSTSGIQAVRAVAEAALQRAHALFDGKIDFYFCTEAEALAIVKRVARRLKKAKARKAGA